MDLHPSFAAMEAKGKATLSFGLSRGRCENLFNAFFYFWDPNDEIFRWGSWNMDFFNVDGCVGVKYKK